MYQVSKNNVEEMKIQIESKPVGMARIDKTLVIAGMDNTIKAFTLKGKRSYQVQLPEQIVSINAMPVLKGSNKQNLLVALKSGEVRLYSTKTLIDKL